MSDNNIGYTSIRLPDTVPGVGYTLKHHNCVKSLIEHYCKKSIGRVDGNGVVFTKQDYIIMMNRGKCHDMDKVVCGLAYPQLMTDYFHRMFNGHHEESMIEPNQKSKYDWMEMIFDMESAKYTKKDKQGGGAYAFASRYKQYIMQYLLPYFKLFNLDREDTGIIKSIKDSVNIAYYESDLMNEILNYIHTTHIHLLDGVSRIDDKGYMAMYNSPVPFRHPSTQRPNGTDHIRPNSISTMSSSINRREFVHGSFEASIFDIDKLCLLQVNQLKVINKHCLDIVETLGQDYQR